MCAMQLVPANLQPAAEFFQDAVTGEPAARMREQHLQPDFSIKRCSYSQTSLCIDTNGNEKEFGRWKSIPVRFSEDRKYLVQLIPRSDGQGFVEMQNPYSRIRLRAEDGASLVHHPGIKQCGHALPEFYKAKQATSEESRNSARNTALVAGGTEVAATCAAASGAFATAEVGGLAGVFATAGAAFPLFAGATLLVVGTSGLYYVVNQIVKGSWIFKCDGSQEHECRAAMEAYLTPAIRTEEVLALADAP